MNNRPRKAETVFALALSFLIHLLAGTAAHARDPYIGILQQERAAEVIKKEKHSAYAIGENNYAYWVWGERSAREAEKNVLQKCNTYVDSQLRLKNTKTCKLVTLNDKYVWPMPPAVGQGELPLPDLPLEKAIVTGDPAKSDAIVLILHGCDGIDLELPSWKVSWQRYFAARNIATITPRSYAENMSSTCDTYYTRYSDQIFRKRVLQTKRTMKVLRARYPGKRIIIWGHSAGAFVAQLYDYKADKLILSGENCDVSRIPVSSNTLFVFGENDEFVDFEQGKAKLTTAQIRKACPKFRKYKNKQILIVKGGTHSTAIWHQNLIDAVSRLIGTKSYKFSEEKWDGLLTFVLNEVKQQYDAGSEHRAMAVRPGTTAQGFIASGWDTKQNAEQWALAECERGGTFAAYDPSVTPVCKIAFSE
jgi:hypothetical protein